MEKREKEQCKSEYWRKRVKKQKKIESAVTMSQPSLEIELELELSKLTKIQLKTLSDYLWAYATCKQPQSLDLNPRFFPCWTAQQACEMRDRLYQQTTSDPKQAFCCKTRKKKTYRLFLKLILYIQRKKTVFKEFRYFSCDSRILRIDC